jgi:hypothetical protein
MGFAFGDVPYKYHKVWGSWDVRFNFDHTISMSDPVAGSVDIVY